MINCFYILFLFFISIFVFNGCDSSPPTLMKANTPFATEEKKEHHIAHMRTHHMHALKHKRDETMYQGIRTEDHSLKACINCHVPERYKGKVLRHTDPEHFCSTCHNYVAQKLNCFECHVDHPVKSNSDVSTKIDSMVVKEITISNEQAMKNFSNLNKLSRQELIDLAFTYSKDKPKLAKPNKSGGVSFHESKNIDSEINNNKGGSNE